MPNPHIQLTCAAALAAAASLVLGACGGGDASADMELSEDDVTLRFTWWGGDERHERTQEVIDLFEQEHPNISVQGEFKEWNGYWDSLATTVAADDAPDIIQMDELYLASYAERGALLDLGSASEFLDTGDFNDDALATGVVDEAQYAMPVGLGMYSMVVNTDILEEYGVEMPDDETWTWDDLMEVGAQISDASGGEVTGVQSWGFNDAGGVNVWARQAGASLYDEEGNVAVPPEVMANYWSYLLELAESGVAPDPSVTIERSTGALDQSGTATNTSAFATWWNTQLTALTAASGSHLELLRLPGESEAESPGAYYKPSMYWSVSSGTDHPAEAALFVDFLANNDEAASILLTERGIPANDRIRSDIAADLPETDAAASTYLDETPVGEAPRVTPPGGNAIEAILARYTERVLFGEITPEEAATGFIDELQGEIDAA